MVKTETLLKFKSLLDKLAVERQAARTRAQLAIKEDNKTRDIVSAVEDLERAIQDNRLTKEDLVVAFSQVKFDNPKIEITVPEIKVPEITVPVIKIPEIKIPDIRVPDVIVPEVKLPAINVPESKITLPEIKMPRGGHMGLVDKPFDEVEMKYNGGQVSDIVYSNGGLVIAIIHLSYDLQGNLMSAKRD